MSSPLPPALAATYNLTAAHHAYRARTLNLIASENVMSPWVERSIDLGLGHRYGDYRGTEPAARKYTGNRHLAALDLAARDALQTLFQCRHADLRPLSGHVAGIAVLMACCQPGDLVLELDAPGGGHRLARKLNEAPLCPLQVESLPLDPVAYNVDVDRTVAFIRERRPRVVILGSSLFLFPHPARPLADALNEYGGILQFDASHVLGLIAGGVYPHPLQEGAHVITSSTHKTFAGPQGGILLTDDDALFERISPAIYPAIVTNHHLHRLPALAAVAAEWQAFGREHAAAVVANARALAAALAAENLPVIGADRGFTATHTILIASPEAAAVGDRLEAADILATPVGLPAELGGGCLRFGVQEITRRGFTAVEAPAVARLIAAAWRGERPPAAISAEVATLVARWQDWRFTWPLDHA
ncbi:MAG: serine hydroxymethyltransferase [Opitutaceae bacterium]|nr:serine hydroxymethyltransferase [Opitutaceae bacterium]